MSSTKVDDKFGALEIAHTAALEDAPKSEYVGTLVSISYDDIEGSED